MFHTREEAELGPDQISRKSASNLKNLVISFRISPSSLDFALIPAIRSSRITYIRRNIFLSFSVTDSNPKLIVFLCAIFISVTSTNQIISIHCVCYVIHLIYLHKLQFLLISHHQEVTHVFINLFTQLYCFSIYFKNDGAPCWSPKQTFMQHNKTTPD